MRTVTNRRGNKKQKPDIVKNYNNSMAGTDPSDQMLSYHSGLRKTLRLDKKAEMPYPRNVFYECLLSLLKVLH